MLVIFLLKTLLTSTSKSFVFFALASRSGLELQFLMPLTLQVFFFGFSKSVSADHIVMAVTRLLGTATACAILLAFAARHRRSYYGVAA